jgi:hypothetical protein
MLEWINVNIIKAALQVLLVTASVLEKPALPNALLATLGCHWSLADQCRHTGGQAASATRRKAAGNERLPKSVARISLRPSVTTVKKKTRPTRDRRYSLIVRVSR